MEEEALRACHPFGAVNVNEPGAVGVWRRVVSTTRDTATGCIMFRS
jgi:hypothetical protein